MTGRTYLEKGRPVTVLARWGRTRPGPPPACLAWLTPLMPNAPRNVLIRREDGTLAVRPFRGLRRPPEIAHDRVNRQAAAHVPQASQEEELAR